MANGTTRVINLRLDASQMNAALNQTASNTTKLASEVKKTNTSLKTMEKDLGTVTKQAQDFNRSIVVFRRAMTALFAVRIAEGFISELQAVDNQLKIATESTEQYTFVQKQLFDVSQQTRQSFEATTKLYARLVRANDQLGLSSSQIIAVTTNINKALAAQGATAQEARSVLLQLSQAFGSGRLAGEEFRAVAEGAPLILKDLADSMGVAVGQLKEMAANGEITGKVLADALQTAGHAAAEFEQSTVTLGQALTKFNNAFQQSIRTGSGVAAFDLLAQAVDWAAENFDMLANVILTLIGLKAAAWVFALAAAFKATLVPALTAAASEFVIVGLATQSFNASVIAAIGSLTVLKAALIATGIGALAVGIGWVITQFGELATAVGGWSNLWQITWLEIQAFTKSVMAEMAEDINSFTGLFDGAADRLRQEAAALRAEAIGIQDDFLAGQLEQANRANEANTIRGQFGGKESDEDKRLKSLAESITKDLRSAAEIYNEAKGDMAIAVSKGFIEAEDAATYLRNLQNELDPTVKASQDFANVMGDMAKKVTALNLGMTEQEYLFRLSGNSAGMSADQVEAYWKVYKTWIDQVDAAAAAVKAEEDAQRANLKAKEDWASLIEDTLTPQQAFINQTQEIAKLAKQVGASDAELAQVLTVLAQKYYDASDAGKSLLRTEEELLALSNALRSEFDSRQINADFDAQENKIRQVYEKGLISKEVYDKAILELDNEKNLRLIENGTKTMQILGQVSEDFVSGFGDAMLEFAKGSEDAFEDFAKSMIDNIAKMVIELLILKPLLESINALIAGMGAGGTTPSPSGTTGGSPSTGSVSLAAANTPSVSGVTSAAARTVAVATKTVSNSNASSVSSGSKSGGTGNVYVNVQNETPAKVEVRERQTSDGTEIEIMVANAVQSSIQNGRLDDAMANTYGIQRRGG